MRIAAGASEVGGYLSRKAAAVTVIRWLLVPVTAFAVWAGTLVAGIMGTSVLDSFCPADQMISGVCTAPWHRPATAVLEMICAAVAAVGFIALPAQVAPALRVWVASICFFVGAAMTFQLVTAGDMYASGAVAAIAGVATLSTIIVRARTRLI